MNQIVKEICQYLISKAITITSEYLPTSWNVQADWGSWYVQDSSEWKLNPKLFRKICRKLRQCNVDFFASWLTKQIEPFISWKADPCCKSVDALQQKRTHKFPYTFPPFSLIGRAVRKLEQDRARIISINPTWQSQS